MEKLLMGANKKHSLFILIMLLMCILMACKKEHLLQKSATFIRTYQTDSATTAISLALMPDGGFIIISSEGSGSPLMTRTDQFGNLKWNKSILQFGFNTAYANAFLLADGSGFMAHSGPNLFKFDTLGNCKMFIIPNTKNFLFDDMSYIGSNFLLPACGHQLGIPVTNSVFVFGEDLNLIRKDYFTNLDVGDGGSIFELCVSSISPGGAYNIRGVKYLTATPVLADLPKLFAARVLPSGSGKEAETIIDSGDQKIIDYYRGHTLTKDSGDILLGRRTNSKAYVYYPVVVMFDKNNGFVWEKEFPIYTGYVNPLNIKSCKDGGFIVVGTFIKTGTAFTQPYIIKIDKDGNKQWDKTIISDQGNGAFYAVTELSDGHFVFVGTSTQFANGKNGTRILFVKTDSNGNL